MSTGSSSKQPWQQSLADAAARVEQELKQAVRTIDEQVVPEVRRHGSSALRSLAEHMNRLAKQMDDAQRMDSAGRPQGPPRDPRS